MTATTLSVEDEARRRFEAETARHGMIILHDDGVYRHLRFMDEKGSSLYWYDLVTWPGSLAFNGDYGSFVFSRSRDMFEFFPRSASSGSTRGTGRRSCGRRRAVTRSGCGRRIGTGSWWRSGATRMRRT
jgi:hypothetical protein